MLTFKNQRGGFRKQKPRVDAPGSNKNKSWKALNMRQPAGATIAELQNMDKQGQLMNKHQFGEGNIYPGDVYQQFEDKFTDIELEKFKEAFIFFDRNGDGTMKADEVSLAMRAMGALVSNKVAIHIGSST